MLLKKAHFCYNKQMGSDNLKKIMFVCTGNICRSAMAEYLMKKIAEEKGKNLEIKSCGTYASDGDISTYDAIEVLWEDYRIDLKPHRATNITKSDIQNSDLILCATVNHKMFVLQMFPKLKGKVYTIKEYAGKDGNLDISDPWGYNKMVYRKCAGEIYDLLEKIIDKV